MYGFVFYLLILRLACLEFHKFVHDAGYYRKSFNAKSQIANVVMALRTVRLILA